MATSCRESELCELCRQLFAESPEAYKCSVHNELPHFHLGPLKGILERTLCPGCRLLGSVAANVQPARDEDKTRHGDVRMTAYPRVLDEMHAHSTETGPSISLQPATKLISVELSNVRTGLAGTIIKKSEAEPLRTGSSASKDKVRGLLVPPDVDVARLKQWIATCRDRHVGCRCAAQPATAPANTRRIRLIDVQERRIVSAILSEERFAALSYVWGAQTSPLMMRAILQQYSSPLGLGGAPLPRTISDAIQLVRDLGMRYLWVDSLCIVQDDADDKQEQLPLMAKLYELAELVIVAASGADADAGLPGVRTNSRQLSQTVETINGFEYMAIQGSIRDALLGRQWDTRGWTYQEACRARRALILTENLVYWSCREETWREDLDNDRVGARLKITEGNSLWGYSPAGRPLGCATTVYCMNVEQFSQRHFKDDSDVLWAYVGILDHQARRFPPNGFIWGHPWGSLSASLLWRNDHFCLSDHTRAGQHSVAIGTARCRIPFPSWSWLSSSAPVRFLDHCGASVVSEVTWRQPFKLGGGSGDGTAMYLRYLRLIDAKGSAEAQQQYEEDKAKLSSAEPAWTGLGVVLDYGLLCCMAQTVELTLRRDHDHGHAPGDPCHLRADPGTDEVAVYATAYSPAGTPLGGLIVGLPFFESSPERTGEFVLLSSNAAPGAAEDDICKSQGCTEIKHGYGCRHIVSHNFMFIEWQKGVAYRRGMLSVDKAGWDQIAPQKKVKKVIVLG